MEKMDRNRIESGFRTVLRWAHLESAPTSQKRRIRQQDKALNELRSENALLNLRLDKAREDHEKLENVIRGLVLNEGVYEDQILELEGRLQEANDRLQTAISSAWSNEQLISFSFFDRPQDPVVDQATSPIDVSELRAAMAEPLVGKITQYNPETGRHDTVELIRSAFLEEPEPKPVQGVTITLLAPGFDGSVDPSHVPGMVLVS